MFSPLPEVQVTPPAPQSRPHQNHGVIAFKPEKMTLYYLYKLFFDTMRKTGNMPFIFNQDSLGLDVVDRRSQYYMFWLFNSWLSIAFLIKHVILLIRCHFLKYDIPDYELIIFWFAGSATFAIYYVNLLIHKDQFVAVVTSCTKFEKLVKDQYQQEVTVKHRKMIWYLFLLFAVGAAGVPILVSGMYWAKPRLPQFLYSIIPMAIDEDPEWWWWSYVLKALLFIFELYTPWFACANIFATDMVSGLSSIKMISSLKHILATQGGNRYSPSCARAPPPPPVRAYKVMTLLWNQMNSAYSQLIAGMELVTLIMFVYAVYITISSPSILIKLFFVFILVFELAHALVTFLPLALVYLRSNQFCGKLRGRIDASKYSRMELRSCRILAIKPMGTHNLTHLTIMELIVIFVNYLQLLFNI